MKSLIVIPARLESTRLPQKLLLNETGRPLIEHTYESASKAKVTSDILVAADDARIVDAVTGFGGRAELTRPDHNSGTDRLAEIAGRYPDVELLINVQGDEPEIDPADIDLAAGLLLNNPDAEMSTLASPLNDAARIEDPACVKVVFDARGRAMYFSRSPIPHPRDGITSVHSQSTTTWHQHVGLYVYRRDALLQLAAASRPPAEVAESLEQLRALHLGMTILVGVTPRHASGIDTLADYQAFVSRTGT
ncbi:MAG: 3-deoxy-manno-octulosonate cytidylyltransferase [Pirellulaceae bacterium]